MLRDFVTGGVTYPWTLVASTLLGAFLLTTPLVFGTAAPQYFSDHVAGCLVILVAVTATAEIERAARFLIAPLGAWIAASPFLLAGATTAETVACVVLGLALIGLSLPRGRRSEETYGGLDRLPGSADCVIRSPG